MKLWFSRHHSVLTQGVLIKTSRIIDVDVFLSSKKRDFYTNHFGYKPEESLEHGITCRPLGEVYARSSYRTKKTRLLYDQQGSLKRKYVPGVCIL